MKTTIDYSTSPAPDADAVADVMEYLGERYDSIAAQMKQVRDPQSFRTWCAFIGIEGKPVQAWYDHFHGGGEWEVAVVLHSVREIIADEGMWCKHDYTPIGVAGIDDPSQPCCIEGAFLRVLRLRGYCMELCDNPAYIEVNERAGFDLPHFNDTHSHSEVLALLDSALA